MIFSKSSLPAHLPDDKKLLLETIIPELAAIKNVAGIVLGGSYASGNFHSTSDLDIGLYYHESRPFFHEEIREAAKKISMPDTEPTVTNFYQWGAWVNGGAWIQTSSGKVDFLYRNIEQVKRTIQESWEGISRHDYDQQPANGYYSVGYLAETKICIPLHDPQDDILRLKLNVEKYPPALRKTIIKDSLWSADFSLQHARKFAAMGDVYCTTGCLVRTAASLTQVIFAINEHYFLNDKRSIDIMKTFAQLPSGYIETVLEVLSHPGKTMEELTASVETLDGARLRTSELAESILPVKR